MADVLDFIDASPAPGITRACFTVAHEARGPGDEKIWFTDPVSADAMGQGSHRAAGRAAAGDAGVDQRGPDQARVPDR